jgi:biopolymer transport protein ExbB/TolQ
MTLAHGIGLGIFGTTFTIVALLIAYIVYKRYRKNIERIEADKKKTTPYDFK